MRKLRILVLLFWVWGTGTGLAMTPVDNHVKNALMDIVKYENQFADMRSVRSSAVKRSLKLLKLTRQRLDGSPNKTHESWIDADRRYNLLVDKLNRFLIPNSPKSRSTVKPVRTQNSKPTATSAGNPSKQMISQYRVRIKKIRRDIQSRADTLDKGGPKPFQDPKYAGAAQQSVNRFKASIAKYSDFKDDPDVVAASQDLARFEKMVKFGRDHAAKELAELGDVQVRLRTINQQIRQLKQPPTPKAPFKAGELGQWLTRLATVRQSAAELYKSLPAIKQRAYLPNNRFTVEQGAPYDFNDVNRMERSLAGLANSIDRELAAFGENLKLVVKNLRDGLGYYDKLDPAKSSDQSNHFLAAGRADEIRAKLAQDKLMASEAAQYAKLLKDPSHADRLALVKQVQDTADQYEANYRKARDLVRMPKAASKDRKLIAIAKQTLARYDSVGDIKQLVVNADKVHRSKETSEEKFDKIDVSLSGKVTLTGTKTTYFYEWDQFQVATAEPVDGKYYIFYNTLKFFTSGASTTPLNKWILSGRIQGSEIPQGNINK